MSNPDNPDNPDKPIGGSSGDRGGSGVSQAKFDEIFNKYEIRFKELESQMTLLVEENKSLKETR